MPLLKSSNFMFIGGVAIFMFTGCDSGSQPYNQIKDLPYTRWDSYAATLPLEQRLDLHKEIMSHAGHNPLNTIEGSFANQPVETYKSIVKRIRHGDKSRYYIGVIYEINRSSEFKICSQPDRAILQSYLDGFIGYPNHERYDPDFYSC